MVVAYKIERDAQSVVIHRCFNGVVDECRPETFRAAVDFIIYPQPDSVALVWDVHQFSSLLFSLLSSTEQEIVSKSIKSWVYGVKIFAVDRLLGLGVDRAIGNGKSLRQEVNLYSLNSWVSESRADPDVKALASLGKDVLEAILEMGLYPRKLTSPAGLYAQTIVGKVPTIYSNESLMEAANCCIDVMNLEWVETYNSILYAPSFVCDLASAYPSFMAILPNTDGCRITYSKEVIPCKWAVVKVKNLTLDSVVHPLVTLERDYFASNELAWVKKHGGTFDVVDGYFLSWINNAHPYEPIVKELWGWRKKYGVISEVAKRMMNGLSGKLDQQNKDGGLGELYNPIYALMVRAGCRLEVMNFIERYGIQDSLVAVNVDSVRTYKDLGLPDKAGIGEWRRK